ncbi:MAG: CDP-alcohol phosphatidyltransferase family protein [Gemmatimonadaceae bacterium]
MFDDWLRHLKDRWMTPLALLIGPRISPNAVTIAAALVGLFCAYLASQNAMIPAFIAWVINRLLDAIDGLLARVHGRQSDFGGYLDIMLDHVVYAAIPIGLLVSHPTPTFGIVTALLLGVYFVNGASWMYLAAILERIGAGARTSGELTTITMPPALVAGAETVIFFSLFFLLPQYQLQLFSAMALLVAVNIVQRLLWAYRALPVTGNPS